MARYPEKAEINLCPDVIQGYRCHICGFVLDEANGGYLYLTNNSGVRIPLKDKDERDTIARMLFAEDAIFQNESEECHQLVDTMEDRVGYLSACICMNCLDQFGLDLRKDTIECPHCKSDHVRTFLEMTNKRCPKCQSGYMDKLDIRL